MTQEPKDTYFRRTIDWMYGKEAYLQRYPSPDVGTKHINDLLGRHPFHPYNAALIPSDACYEPNTIFYECMTGDHVEGYETHQKHVACYYPYKLDLMKCVASEKRKARLEREAFEKQALAPEDTPQSSRP